MSPVEQALLYAVTIVILAGTLVVVVLQLVRGRRGGPPRGDRRD